MVSLIKLLVAIIKIVIALNKFGLQELIPSEYADMLA